MTDTPLTLSSGPLELQLAPDAGGAIARLDLLDGGRTPVLRPGPSPLNAAVDAACFPLVPFANRIRGGVFRFRGRKVHLPPHSPDASPLHGQGWTSTWRVERESRSQAVLAFDHSPGEWPWAYEARQHFDLEEDALNLRLACRNMSAEDMPCGVGLHPFFPCGEGTRIQTEVEEVWLVDENVLPVAREPAAGRYAVADDPVCGRGLDNGYSGWSGRALFTDEAWPFELELSSPAARFFHLYSPGEGGFFAAEPVSHANAALNEPKEDWPALGIRILNPGQEMDIAMRIELRLR